MKTFLRHQDILVFHLKFLAWVVHHLMIFVHILIIPDGDFETFISLFGFWCCIEHTKPNRRAQFGYVMSH